MDDRTKAAAKAKAHKQAAQKLADKYIAGTGAAPGFAPPAKRTSLTGRFREDGEKTKAGPFLLEEFEESRRARDGAAGWLDGAHKLRPDAPPVPLATCPRLALRRL
jgi:hypothetical protein